MVTIDEAYGPLLKSSSFGLLVVLHLHLVEGEVKGGCEGVCRTASKMPLVEDSEAT